MKKVLFILLLILNQNIEAQQCWKEVSSSAYNVIGISTNGKLWTWGRNEYGQLGNGTIISLNTPTQIGTNSNWKTCSATLNDSYAINNNGILWAWGRNNDFNHGDGTNTSKLIPTQIGTDTNWDKIAASVSHVLAIKTDGTLWAWGINSGRQLGDGTDINRTTPVQIGTDNDWKLISCGNGSSLALKNNGTLWSWGSSGFALNPPSIFIPTQVGTDTNWKEIQLFYTHAIAIKTNGTLWAWGDNSEGQIGNGTTINQFGPLQIGTDTDWKTGNSGFQFSMAIKNNGTLWGWGENVYGKLGNGSANTIGSLVPIQIGINTNWKTIDLGYYHATATYTETNNLASWGWNGYGQLGNGNESQSNVPVFIACPTTLALNTNDFEKNAFLVYPNPTNDFITIKSYYNDKISQIKIIDILGKVIINKQNSYENIDVSDLKSGLFFIEIKADNEKTTLLKFIKQ